MQFNTQVQVLTEYIGKSTDDLVGIFLITPPDMAFDPTFPPTGEADQTGFVGTQIIPTQPTGNAFFRITKILTYVNISFNFLVFQDFSNFS